MSSREDFIARTRGGTPPSKDPIKQRESAYRNMADRGIRSLSGRTTADDKGEIARDIQKHYISYRDDPRQIVYNRNEGPEDTPYEDTLYDFRPSGGKDEAFSRTYADIPLGGLLTETKGDRLRQNLNLANTLNLNKEKTGILNKFNLPELNLTFGKPIRDLSTL